MTAESFQIARTAAVRLRGPRRAGAFPVVCNRLHPTAEARALELAGRDRRRLVILSTTTVIVLNRPRGKRS